jgi:ABC-type multidrug transport system, ATPase and permease components
MPIFRRFVYFKKTIGWHIYPLLVLNIFISLFDSFALAMFVPLIGLAAAETVAVDALGNLRFLTDFLIWLGVPLSLPSLLALLFSLFAIKGVFRFIQKRYYTYIRYLFLLKVRFGLINDLEAMSYSGFINTHAGTIQNTLVGEVSRVFVGMERYFNSLQYGMMVGTYVILAFIANWAFAILVVLGVGVLSLLYQRFLLLIRESSQKISKRGHDFNGLLIQGVTHFKYLRATDAIHNYFKKLRQTILESEKLFRRMGHYDALLEGVREPLIIGLIAIVVCLQIYYLNGYIETIMVSLLFFYRGLSYLIQAQTAMQGFAAVSGSFASIDQMEAKMKSVVENTGVRPYNGFQRIHLEKLGLQYDDYVVFKDIDIVIPKNHTIALVGESGVGKTSLAGILSGLFPPSQGQVLLDDTSLEDMHLDSFRRKVGYILQDPVIFLDSIYNNITFWSPRTPENIQKFYSVLERTSLSSFVESLPDKENTLLGPQGIMASGGQGQRIAIARELFKEVDILIMDEATSALDTETEKIIQENIELLKGRYTLCIIAHRLSTIRNADTIYLMGDKGILAAGSFKELLEKSPIFKKMVDLQQVTG